ncbi:MAG: VOC family protein [Terracidiphilus sp.]
MYLIRPLIPQIFKPVLAILLLALGSEHTLKAANSSPRLRGIAHAAVRVSSLEKSRAFFGHLGFQQAFVRSANGHPTESFIKINDRQFIELYPASNPSQQPGFMHVCFESSDLEDLRNAYVARGLTPIHVLRAGAGNLLFTMRGPEDQNLEYTQYMPGSMHMQDRGNHLGPDRISDHLLAVSVPMQDPVAARTFYMGKMAFTTALAPTASLRAGHFWLALPGQDDEFVAITPRMTNESFELVFAVPDLRQTKVRLQALGLHVQRGNGSVAIQDPDGNRLIFVQK